MARQTSHLLFKQQTCTQKHTYGDEGDIGMHGRRERQGDVEGMGQRQIFEETLKGHSKKDKRDTEISVEMQITLLQPSAAHAGTISASSLQHPSRIISPTQLEQLCMAPRLLDIQKVKESERNLLDCERTSALVHLTLKKLKHYGPKRPRLYVCTVGM